MMTPTTRETFELKVDRSGGPDACHPWTRGKSRSGYGKVGFQGKHHRAHRVAFYFEHGRWPEPLCLHRCDNPACCNPRHLFEGTDADNIADRDSKGRQASGARNGSVLHPESRPRGDVNWARQNPGAHAGANNGNAKLTDQDVRDIRANYVLCRVSRRELAERYGVGVKAIHDIISGRRWTADGVRIATHRRAMGERVHTCRLTEQQVRDMRAIYAQGGVTQQSLGERFGVNHRTVNQIVRGQTWRHLGF